MSKDSYMSASKHTTIYHALEDKIQKRHATGYLKHQHDGSTPQTRHAATPRDALATRIGSHSSRIPDPSPSLPLPATDLLNAIHGYTAHLYATESPHAHRSLDESALLTIGLVAEELVRACANGPQDHLLLQATSQALASEAGIFQTPGSENEHEPEASPSASTSSKTTTTTQ